MSSLYKDLPLTSFPSEGIDNFIEWLDITASDGPLIKQYTEAMQSGNIPFANQILSQIPSGTRKIIKASDLNKLTQAILAVERFYKSDVKDYILEKQAQWQQVVDRFTFRGEWSPGTTYEKDNLVSYYVAGLEYIYIAISNPPAGNSPTDENYWRSITVRGQQGYSGKGLSYRGRWLASESYSADDAVTYDGALWMALSSSQNVEPNKTSNVWKLVMALESTLYPIQSNQPNNQAVGDLWFNTSNEVDSYHLLLPLESPALSSDIKQGKMAYDSNGDIIIGSGV